MVVSHWGCSELNLGPLQDPDEAISPVLVGLGVYQLIYAQDKPYFLKILPPTFSMILTKRKALNDGTVDEYNQH